MKELVSELLWFQRYISDNGLETQMEIKDDKIVFFAGETLIEWDVDEARRIRTEVMTDPRSLYNWAIEHDVRFELGEPTISKDVYYSYWYTLEVIKGRFELAESVIASSATYSLLYAKDVIKGRWELAESAISENTFCSYVYAKHVIKGRFELGEPAISKDAGYYSQQYQKFLCSLQTY